MTERDPTVILDNTAIFDVNKTFDLDLNQSARSVSVMTSKMTSVDIASIVVSLVVFLFIYTGNLMTILAVYRTPSLRIPQNLHVVSLALADLLAGLMLLYQTVKYLPGLTAHFNTSKLLCLSRHAVLVTSLVASGNSMVLIAVDRLLYIQLPLDYDRLVTQGRTVVSIGVSWVVSLLVGTVSLYYNNWDQAPACTMFQVFTVVHNVYIIGSMFLLYCVIIACCYCVIITTACRQHRATTFNPGGDVVLRRRIREGWPVARMFLLVYATFFVCWTPCMVTLVVGYTVGVNVVVMNFLMPLGVLNCALNFIIYAVMNTDFRRAFHKMLPCGKT